MGNIANQEVMKMSQQSTKTDMRPWMQMAIMKRQKTYPTATLSEQTPDNTPKQVQETNRNSTKPVSNQWYQPRQDNNRNHYISQPPEKTMPSTYSNTVSRKKKKTVLFSNSILKTLRMGEFNSFVTEGEVCLKAFPGAKANKLNYQIISVIQGNNYDPVAIHVGISDSLSSHKSVSDICRDISIRPRCRSNNISQVFISNIACISKINKVLMQRLNRTMYEECGQNGFTFVDNGAVTQNDLWVDGIHLQESVKNIIANNSVNNLSHFSEPANPLRWYL